LHIPSMDHPEKSALWVAIALVLLVILGLGTTAQTLASPPSAPGSLTATSVSSTQVSLSWTASVDSGATVSGYVIERCQGSGCTSFNQIASIGPTTTYLDSNLSPSTTYVYQVQAQDSLNTASTWSSPAAAPTSAATVTGGITYGYDALGRLVQASVSGNSTVQNYIYDASGNITSMTSSPQGTLGIANLSNGQGAVGTEVILYGSGFSTDPSADTVTFNGVAATVVSATATQLVVVVPAGTTSGPITVSTATGSVTTSNSFTVAANAAVAAPTIAGFLPPVALAGATLTISGTGFQSTPGANRVQINGTWAPVVSATATTLTVGVPTQTGSGLISVYTPTGTATASCCLVIPPSGYTVTQVALSGMAAVNGPAQTVNISSTSVSEVEVFNGIRGQQLTLGISNFALTRAQVSVFGPDGSTLLAPVTITASGQGIPLPALPKSGTYSVVISPSGYTGSVALSIVGPLSAGALTLNGPGTPVTLSVPGQTAMLTFSGTQGSSLTLSLTGVTLSAGTLSILNPNGSVLISSTFGTAGATLMPELPTSGTYTVLVTPTGGIGGSFTAALSSTAAATVTLNSGVYNLGVTNQTPVTLTFEATAGTYMTLGLAESGGSVYAVTVAIDGPNQAQLVSTTEYFGSPSTGNGQNLINLGLLPESGTYSITIAQTSSSGTGTLALSLSTPLNQGALTPATNYSVTPSLLGQGVIATFTDVGGDCPSLMISGDASSGSSQTNIATTVFAPDGATVATFAAGTSSPLSLGPLPQSGTYTVLMQQTVAIGGTTLAFEFLTALTATLPANGSGVALEALSGQDIIGTFSGTQGQYITLTFASAVSPYNLLAAGGFFILSPEGSEVATGTFTPAQVCVESGGSEGENGLCVDYAWIGSGSAVFGPLPDTGTYTVLFEDANAAVGAASLIASVTQGPAGTATLNSTATQTTAGTTFSGTAGTAVSVAVTPSSSKTTVSLVGPNGNVIAGPSPSSSVLNVSSLTTTGTYTVLTQNAPTSIGLTVATAVSGSLTLGTPATISLSLPGQGAQYSFSGTSGQYLTLSATGSTTGVANGTVSILNPDGSVLTTSTFVAYDTFLLQLPPLPTSGTYTAVFEQTTAGSGSLTLTLASVTPLSTPVSNTVSTSTAGQNASFSFSAAGGQIVSVAITNLAFTPSTVGTNYYLVSGPVSSWGESGFCSAPGCLLVLGLPATGTYTVTLYPQGSATQTFNETVSPAFVGTLTANTPVNLNLTSAGQGAVLTFEATAGEIVDLTASGVTTSPANAYMEFFLYDPSGNEVTNFNTSTGSSSVPTLTKTGTYTLVIYPNEAVTSTVQITMAPVPMPPVVTTGTTTNFSTSVPGDVIDFTFAGVTGQDMSMSVANMTLTPNSVTEWYVDIYNPDGTAGQTQACYSDEPVCEFSLINLPQTGTYRVAVLPGFATMSFSVTLSEDVAGTLALNSTIPVNLSAVGQSAFLTFSVTPATGRTLALAVSNLTTTPANTPYEVFLYSFNTGWGEVGQMNSNILNLPTLAEGSYALVVVPMAPATATMQVSLQPGVTPTLALNATGTQVSTSLPGENAYLAFSATTGQSVSLTLSNLTMASGSGYVTLNIYNPNGTILTSYSFCDSNSGCVVSLTNLPQTGTYEVTVLPSASTTMSFTATVSTDITAALAADTPLNIDLAAVGQNAIVTFTATAGETVYLTVGDITTVPTNTTISFYVYNPSGGTITNAGSTTGATVTLSNLAAGTYTVWISPAAPATATLQVSYQ
jgi:large repetitive protein